MGRNKKVKNARKSKKDEGVTMKPVSDEGFTSMEAVPGISGLAVSSVERQDEFTLVASKVRINVHNFKSRTVWKILKLN